MNVATLEALKPVFAGALILGALLWVYLRGKKEQVVEGEFVMTFSHAATYQLPNFTSLEDTASMAAVALQLDGYQTQGFVLKTTDGELERFSDVSPVALKKIKQTDELRVTFVEVSPFFREIRKIEVLVSEGEERQMRTVFVC